MTLAKSQKLSAPRTLSGMETRLCPRPSAWSLPNFPQLSGIAWSTSCVSQIAFALARMCIYTYTCIRIMHVYLDRRSGLLKASTLCSGRYFRRSGKSYHYSCHFPKWHKSQNQQLLIQGFSAGKVVPRSLEQLMSGFFIADLLESGFTKPHAVQSPKL